jgi:hypothetical protein
LVDRQDMEAEGLDQRQESVQTVVVFHRVGDDSLGRYCVDVHPDEGVARTIGQSSRDPDLVPSRWHDPSPLMSSAAADDLAASFDPGRVPRPGPHPCQMKPVPGANCPRTPRCTVPPVGRMWPGVVTERATRTFLPATIWTIRARQAL